ncbi:3-(3-hydroxy-phenyl)propionate transporter [Pseudomonas coronafaciens]|nr:3-(3-hydroxy-phenyl)propionate transporter [Pseudomonas coronafaciens]
MYAGVPLGGALAAVVAMFTSEHWQTTFIIGGLAPLLVAPLMILLLPESSAFKQQTSASAIKHSAASALFGEGRTRTTLALWVGYFFTLTVMYMLLNWLPSLLIAQGFSKPQAGMVQMLFNIGGALGSLLGGLLLDRCNGMKVVLFVYAGLLAALAGVGVSVGIVPMAMAGFAAGVFVMAAQLVLYALAPPAYPHLGARYRRWGCRCNRSSWFGRRPLGCRAIVGRRCRNRWRTAGDLARPGDRRIGGDHCTIARLGIWQARAQDSELSDNNIGAHRHTAMSATLGLTASVTTYAGS